jgi:hypothetical protein
VAQVVRVRINASSFCMPRPDGEHLSKPCGKPRLDPPGGRP